MAQDSYSGKVYLALEIGETVEGLMNVWVSTAQRLIIQVLFIEQNLCGSILISSAPSCTLQPYPYLK